MQTNINEILEDEMAKFLKEIDNPMIRNLLSYYFDLGGKRVRPTLFYTISKAFDSEENLAPFSLVLELIHTMSLYHDDVIDNADERRGAPTIHKKWDISTAIVGGDIFHGMIHNYILLALRNSQIKNEQNALQFISDLIMKVELEIGTAVLLEMQMANDKIIPSMDEIIKVTEGKTAPLFAFSASAAASLANQDKFVCKQLYDMGLHLGYAFQLLDDLSDYFPSNKGTGNDLREDRKTPILALSATKSHERVLEYRLLGKNLTEDHILQFIEEFKNQFLEICDWIDQALTKAENLLDVIPNNRYKENMCFIIKILFTKNDDIKLKLKT